MKNANQGVRYEISQVFFELGGSAVMYLTANAAVEVSTEAAARGLIIGRIEGGVWHYPGFEARLDCIWDGIESPAMLEEIIKNNRRAIGFIREEQSIHDTFVLTTLK